MSIKVMSAVWEHYPAGGSELLALLALADWSDDDGRCFPSVAAIAKKTRLSKSQAQRVMHGLIDAGVVVVEGNESGGAPGSTRRYRVAVSRLTGRMGAIPTGSAHATPTGRMDATGSAHATGRTHAADGSHGCGETGRMGATQTVIEPSITNTSPNGDGGKSAVADVADPCPHRQIIDLYHRILPTGRQVREWTPARAASLRSRWRESPKRQNLDWWERFFAYCAKSPFLTGQTHSHGRRPFELSLDWLVKAENMAKVIEGAYEADEVAA